MSLKAAIFDLDGVVVDTVPLHFKAWQRMFADYNVPFTFEDYKQKVDGIPRIDGARAIFTDMAESKVISASNKKQEYFLENIEKEDIPVFKSTFSLIKDLRKENIKTAIISSSKNCYQILERVHLLSVFDVKITGNDIIKGKPDPQIFLMAAEKLNVLPCDCMVFEDAVLGVESAKNAGMRCVGIDRHNDPERLKKADIIVNDLSEITLTKIKSLMG
ncbi:MAG: beta-phosphoglucomutase family hydrolase [Elusimicrobiota bacterium]